MANTKDRLCISYACITCLLYCASDVNVNFEDVLDHMTLYILPLFTSKRLRHMTASVCSKYQ